jgi:rRNA maturation endonuclease Nob1
MNRGRGRKRQQADECINKDIKMRSCLGCKKTFRSTGRENRFCDVCGEKLSDSYKENKYTSRYMPCDISALDG